MKEKIFVVLMGFVLMFSFFCSAQAATVQPLRFSDFFSGRLEMGVAVDPIDLNTGIRLCEGLGGNTSLTIIAKQTGAYFNVGYRADAEGSDDPLAKIFSFGAGWTSGSDPNIPQVSFGVEGLDLHEFSENALKFRIMASKPIWNALDTYYASVIFRAEGIAPMSTNGDKYLNGANASVALRLEATADQHLGLMQEFRAGVDGGSYGYVPAGLLSYAIYGKIKARNLELIFPRVTCFYANENGGEERYALALRRDKEMAMIDFAATYKF